MGGCAEQRITGMSGTSRRTLIGIAVVLAAVTLGGCGSSSGTEAPADNGVAALSVTEILAKSSAAVKVATSVHVVGDAGTTSLDLVLTRTQGSSGTITSDGQPATVLVTGDNVFLKADKAFWTKAGGAVAATLIGDRWVKAPKGADSSFAALANFADYTKFLEGALKPTGDITKGVTKTVNGVPCIGLSSTKGGTLYVATNGEPLPIRIEPPAGTKGGVDFKDWNTATPLPEPTGDAVIDYETIKKG